MDQSVSVVAKLSVQAKTFISRNDLPQIGLGEPASMRGNDLANWLLDPAMTFLPNPETRGHIGGDLGRYASFSPFMKLQGRLPNASDFPSGTASAHGNWFSGNYAD